MSSIQFNYFADEQGEQIIRQELRFSLCKRLLWEERKYNKRDRRISSRSF